PSLQTRKRYLMKRTLSCFVLLAVSLLAGRPLGAQLPAEGLKPPVARKEPKSFTIHGDTRIDNYFWLRNKGSRDVTAYLEAENAYTAAVMKPTEGLQKKLYAEILARIKETDLSVPYRQDGYWYYTRTEQGKQYPIHCRKPGSLEGKEQVTLDLNELASKQ